MARDPSLSPRKEPVQGRSRATVDAILEGAAQVLTAHGFASATTNQIAERAGVSIGTLYQYFPNKEALLVAVVEQGLERGAAQVVAALTPATAGAPLRDALAAFVDAMIALHCDELELTRALFDEAPHPPELHECVLRAESTIAHALCALLERHPEARPRADAAARDRAAHLAAQVVEASTHRFSQRGLHDTGPEAFRDELVALLVGYLGGAHDAPA